ncbi:MAG: hypothetical protein GWQ05_05150 [Verrucomicrobiaceae bacterium]|nr:hypothetical protein [Verrucomicrobiaceae bacterium]NCF90332.1 hypothetical protein [Verrucomicrobiaceae bacterium]
MLAKSPNQRPTIAREVVRGFESQVYRRKIPRRLRLPHSWIVGGLGLTLISIILGWHYSRPYRGTPVYIEGSSIGYSNLATAIAEAASGATIVLRDGIHELAGETTLFHPIHFVVEQGSRPIIHGQDTRWGTLFQAKASATFEGLTSLADTLMIAYQEQPVLDELIKKLFRSGRADFYNVKRFLRLVHAKGISADKQLSQRLAYTFPQAVEIDPLKMVESLPQPDLPRDSNDIPTWMQRLP